MNRASFVVASEGDRVRIGGEEGVIARLAGGSAYVALPGGREVVCDRRALLLDRPDFTAAELAVGRMRPARGKALAGPPADKAVRGPAGTKERGGGAGKG